MRLLVGHALYTDRLSYYDDWLDAFARSPRFDAKPFNIVDPDAAEKLPALIAETDAIVLLHSTNGDTTTYIEPLVPIFADRRVPMLTFVGNEVNLPGSPIADKRRIFAGMRPEYVATQLLKEAGDFLFADVAGVGVVEIPHALNPQAFALPPPGHRRDIDIGARSARYIPHLGDDDRNRLLDWFRIEGPGRGLAVDIDDSRFDREGWARFLASCKATVATEAGSWFLERDDATVEAIRSYVLAASGGGFVIRNDSALRKIGHKLPWWVRALARKALKAGPIRHEALVNESLPKDEIYARFFANRPRPAFYGKCISSRHFDAIGTGTCQIMFRGRYNDLLNADEHYLALEPDFSNVDDVIARFRDPAVRERIVTGALARVHEAHTYAHRTEQVFELLAALKRR